VVALAVVAVAGPAHAAGDDPVPSTRLFTIAGDDVYESSGLVDRGSTVFTVNDSGDDAVVYGLDPRTGRTVSRTTYADSVSDVEALAPGSDGTVWAADTGDNQQDRDDVSVYRLRPRDGRQPAARYRLAYPDGPHDAETLLVQPRTQRVFVVSKSAFGGTVYVAPRDLREGLEPNRLKVFARVPGLVTDGSFFGDGRHVVLRTYGTASVFGFPGFELTGTARLPDQRQGEGISVAGDGRVLVSSEGVHEEVLSVRLPASLSSASPRPSPSGPSPDTKGPAEPAASHAPARDAGDWGGIALVAAAVAGLIYLTVRRTRHR